MADNNNNNPNIIPPDNNTPYLSAIINQFGTDTAEPSVKGLGYSPDNGVHFYVTDTIWGRKYRQEDANRLWPYLKKYIGGTSGTVTGSIKWADILDKPDLVTETELNQRLTGLSTGSNVVNWNEIQNKPDLVTKNDLDERLSHRATTIAWSQVTDKPDLATKQDLRNISSTPGPAGHDGKSAYEIAVDNGFTGSQAEWLQSLHGRDGTSSTSGDNSLSTQAIAELIKQHLRVQIDSSTGNLIVKVDDQSNGSIADTVAVKVAQSCHFSLDNGNLVMTVGGA